MIDEEDMMALSEFFRKVNHEKNISISSNETKKLAIGNLNMSNNNIDSSEDRNKINSGEIRFLKEAINSKDSG